MSVHVAFDKPILVILIKNDDSSRELQNGESIIYSSAAMWVKKITAMSSLKYLMTVFDESLQKYKRKLTDLNCRFGMFFY